MYAFECPSTPDISSPHVRIQRNRIHVGFFSCNASFNQPKVPVWKDHIVVNPQLFCIWSRRRASSLGSKASFFVPFTQHMRMYEQGRQGVLFNSWIFWAWRADCDFRTFQGTQQDLQRRRRGGRRSCRRPVLYTHLSTQSTPSVPCDSITEAWNL